MEQVLLVDWTNDFAMIHECEKSRMKEATKKLTSLVSSLSLGCEEMPIEGYTHLVGEEIVDA